MGMFKRKGVDQKTNVTSFKDPVKGSDIFINKAFTIKAL